LLADRQPIQDPEFSFYNLSLSKRPSKLDLSEFEAEIWIDSRLEGFQVELLSKLHGSTEADRFSFAIRILEATLDPIECDPRNYAKDKGWLNPG
jgi:hypothetical protein